MNGTILANRSAVDRNKTDFYATPPEVTVALLDFLESKNLIKPGCRIWEPACGDLAMAKVMTSREYFVLASDLHPQFNWMVPYDFLNSDEKCDWIITNPPFSKATEFITHALELGKPCAFLLKSQFWHARSRLQLFRDNPPSYVLPLTWRPDFLQGAKSGSPTMECQWTVWAGGHDTIYYPPRKTEGGDQMRLATYDCEVYAYDWLVVFKDYETKHFTVIHNDTAALQACINDDTVYCGFNSKSYDQYIIKAIAAGFSPEEVKQVNDWIIAGNQGWECPLLQGVRFWFNNIDIKDDMQMGLSLKAIEGHLGMDICESEVDFTLDRPLTREELESTIFYCKHDVDATEKILDLRKNYLQNKINIGKLANLGEVKAMSMTNAKLTAALLQARPVKHDDERAYQYPENLRREYIPQEVFDFFNRMKDEGLSDKDVFTGKLNISIGECPVTIGYGGIHGAIPNFLWEEVASE